MTDLIFNIENLSKININQGTLIDIANSSDFLKKVRYIHSIGKPWGEWERVCQFLDDKAEQLDFITLENFRKISNINYKFNFLYIFSSFSRKNPCESIKLLSTFHNVRIIQILSRDNIAHNLIQCALTKEEALNYFSPLLLGLLIIRMGTLCYPKENEIKLIKFFNEKFTGNSTSTDIMLKELLNTRLRSISKPTPQKNSPIGKIAIFITGQARNCEQSFSLIKSAIQDINKNYDIYISSWEDVGGYVAEESKLTRHMNSNDIQFLIENGYSIEKIAALINKFYSSHKTTKLSSSYIKQYFFSNNRNLHINLKNDKEFPYNEMTNPEKMYYHNSFWIRTIAKEYFSRNYSHILKIRPDVDIKLDFVNSFDFPDNSVLTEDKNGWIFRDWGMGTGDQILFGPTSVMLNILDLYKSNPLIENICKTIFSKPTYQGHMNIGLAAWLNGYEILPNNLFNHKLINNPKLTIQELEIKK